MKPTLSRILVPTDFSVSSDAALEYGKLLAEEFGASLHLLHVIEEPITAGAWGSVEHEPDVPGNRAST
jgi:nucleotide-binding universal stress UspA family protein